MPPFRALRERSDHRAARRHVDARRQGFSGKHHLHQPLLKQLFDQLFPGRKHSCVMGCNPTQQRISMKAIANSLRICDCICLESLANDRLLTLRDQTLNPKVANGLVTTTAAEDEIDGGEHLPLRHLRHYKADRWCFRLRRPWRTTFALMPFWSTPNLAIGMNSSSLFI